MMGLYRLNTRSASGVLTLPPLLVNDVRLFRVSNWLESGEVRAVGTAGGDIAGLLTGTVDYS